MDFSNLTQIYIFGAHSRARTLAVYLTALCPKVQIAAFLVDNDEKNPPAVNQVPVINITEKKVLQNFGLQLDAPVFIGTRGVSHKQIEKHLASLGFGTVYPVTVELDLKLRNAFLTVYFEKHGRKFEKIDDYAGKGNEDFFSADNKSKTATVYVAQSVYDKELSVPWPLADYERGIQVGAALTEKRISSHSCLDNVGENISEKNKQYCELTAMYWIWKNAKEDIVGLEHYRRHFLLPEKWLRIMEEYGIDVILPVPLYVEPSLEENYRSRHDERDLDYLFQYAGQQDKTEVKRLKAFWKKNLYSPCNMFIMRKQILDELCMWLFPILDKVAEHGGQKKDAYLNRYPGFLAERMTSYFFEIRREKYKIVYADKNFLQ